MEKTLYEKLTACFVAVNEAMEEIEKGQTEAQGTPPDWLYNQQKSFLSSLDRLEEAELYQEQTGLELTDIIARFELEKKFNEWLNNPNARHEQIISSAIKVVDDPEFLHEGVSGYDRKLKWQRIRVERRMIEAVVRETGCTRYAARSNIRKVMAARRREVNDET